jgi:hypothetical protein
MTLQYNMGAAFTRFKSEEIAGWLEIGVQVIAR